MEDAVRQRIISLFAESGVSINSLSNGDKAFQRKMNRQINEGAAITCETITSILEAFPNISAEWLLRGEGEMLKTSSAPAITDVDVSVTGIGEMERIDSFDSSLIEELKAEINMLKGENRVLREQVGLGERKGSRSAS